MKISLMENGLDSLKKGFDHLKTYEEMYFIKKEGKERFYVLKDAVLNIHHGIEILLKQTLIETNEILVFSEIDRALKNAFHERKQKKLNSIFETSHSPHTVTLQEAVDRIQKICGHALNSKFQSKIEKLEHYRNQITHSAVFLEEAEINNVFSGLVDEIDVFFMNTLGAKYKTVTGYADFKQNYKTYLDKLNNTLKAVKGETTEKLIEAFTKCGISMGENEFKIIDDIDVATNLLDVVTNSKLSFGMDMYNGYCSGNVSKIKRISNNRFSIFAKDNYGEYRFKFKSLMLYMPSIESEFSPIIFLEADKCEIDKSLQKFAKQDYHGRTTIEGIYFNEEKRYEWDEETISEFYSRIEYDEYFTAPPHWHIEDFLDEGIFCFLNVQRLKYGNIQQFLRSGKSLKELEVILRKSLTK
jgi:hypothetical protein